MKNLGTVDRSVRIIIGLLVLPLLFIGTQTLWALLGLIPLFSGLRGFCPIYQLFGLSTCPLK